MRDTSGYEVFGLYGNDATTKSWGNFTLSAGDLVLGQNRASKSAIRWTQATGKFGFYGNGSGTVQVEIATDGSLQAGAGKVVLNSNGVSLTQSASNSASVLSSTDGSRVKWNTLEMFNAAYDTWVDPVYSYTWYRYTGVIREATSGANDNSRIYITAAHNPGAGYAGPELVMDAGPVIETYTYNYLDFSNGSIAQVIKLQSYLVHANARFVVVDHTNGGQVRVIQGNTTAAKPPLRLGQSDLSEEMIRFDTTVAAGNPVNTTALGAYYGRVRVSVNGTFYWMPLYK